MNAKGIAHVEHRRRFVTRLTIGFAVLFMILLIVIQLQVNGVQGLRDGPFLGLTLGVGIVAFRYGRFFARVIERVTRGMREPKV